MEAPVLTVCDLIDLEREAGQQFGPFHQHWLLQRAPEKVRRYLQLAREHPHIYGMPTQGFAGPASSLGGSATAAFGARNTSASELNMLQDGTTGASAATSQAVINQYCAIAPADIFAGKTYRLTMGGVYGNTGTPTMTFTPRWGSSPTPGTNVTLGASAAWTSITGTTALPYFIQFDFTVWTAPPGATIGTGRGFGFAVMQIPVTSSQLAAPLLMGGTTGTIDTTGQGTAGCGLTMNLTWSASNSANTSTCSYFLLSSLN